MTPSWPTVVLALIAAVPAIIAAVFAGLTKRELKTGNGKTVGEMVTEVHGKESTAATTFDAHT